MRVESVQTAVVTFSPGNGTRYRIFVSPDSEGGLQWSWPDARAGGWADSRPGGEVRVRWGKISPPDRKAIAAALDELRSGDL